LVQRWYPLSQESQLRKSALEKILQLFPDDSETLYDARLSLAYIDFYACRFQEANAAYEKLAAKQPAGVLADSYALSHYMMGSCAYEMKEFKKAAAAYQKSVAVEGVSPYRRGWGLTYQAQSLMRTGQLDQALEIFLRAEKIESNHRADLLNDLIHCYLKKEQVDEAVAAWERLKPALGEEAMSVLTRLAGEPADPLLASNEQLKKFFESLRSKLDQEEAAALDSLVGDFTYQREKLKKAAELRTKILALLEKTAPDYLSQDLYESIGNQTTYQEKLDTFLRNDSEQWLEHCYGYLARFEVDDGFTTFFWNFMLHVKWKESSLPKARQVLMESLIPLCDLIPHQDDNHWETLFAVADWHQGRDDWKKAEEIFHTMTRDPLFNEEFAASAWRRRGIALEHLGKWEEAVKVHLHLKDQKMESGKSCDQLMRAGWIQARLGKPDEALKTWSLLEEVPKSLYESLDDSELIGEAVLLAGMPEKTKSYWKRTEQWWSETLADYLKANGLEISAQPLLADHLQELAINKHLTKKVEEIDLEELNEIITVILSGARWFPSFTERVQDLFEGFVRPITVAKNEDFRRMALTLLDTVNAGSEKVQVAAAGQALFFKSILKDATALDHGYRLLERLNDEGFAGAREVVLRRLSFIAIRDRKELEKVEKLLREDWKLSARVNIGMAISQILVARGLAQEAIDFTKGILTTPSVKENPAYLKSVEEYLETLEGESKEKRAFEAHIERIHQENPVPWLAHVSPELLGEERFEDPADFLQSGGDERHPLEDYKWGILLLKSNLITKEQRPFVFEKLLAFHLDGCLKSSEHRTIANGVLNDELLPEDFRRIMVWKLAVDGSFMQADGKRVEELAAHPLCEGLNDELRIEGFQDLIATNRAINGSAREQVAQIKAFIERGDLNKVTFGCVVTITQATRRMLDEEASREVEKLLKSIKYEGMTSRELRQEAFRYRKETAETFELFQFVPILKLAFKERLVELAKQAPVDWLDFRNYDNGLGLDHTAEAHIYAKLILEGPPVRSIQERSWRTVIPHLLVKDETTLDREALKRFAECLNRIESEETVALLFEAASVLPYFKDELREQSLKEWGPWVKNRKNRDLADSFLVSRIVAGVSSPSEDELLRLARKFSRQDNAATWTNNINLLELLLDREEQAPLKALLRNLPEDAYEVGSIAAMALQAYRQIGDQDEVEYLEEEMHAGISHSWMKAWHQKSVHAFQSAVSAFWLVERKKGEPIPIWMKEIPKTMRLKVERVRCELLLLMTEGKWQEYEEVLKKNLDLLEEAEVRVLLACGDLGLKRDGALERAQKILHSPDKRDSYILQLRQMLKKKSGDD